MKKIRFKVEGRHIKNCLGIRRVKEKQDVTPWAWCIDGADWRDSAGRKSKHPSGVWLVIPCNDIGCRAKLLIRVRDIITLIPNKKHWREK